jgi:hypothetical protein
MKKQERSSLLQMFSSRGPTFLMELNVTGVLPTSVFAFFIPGADIVR